MGFSGGKSGGSQTYQAADPEAARRLAAVAERQVSLGERQEQLGEQIYVPYEQAMVNANMGLVQPQADLAKSEIQSSQDLLPQREEASKLSLEETARDIVEGRAVKDAIRNAQVNEINASQPVMEQFYQQAAEGVQPRYEQVVSEAQADQAQAYGQSRDAMARNLSRMGIDPTSGKYADAMKNNTMDMARGIGLARSSARTSERNRVEDTNFQRLTTAMGIRGKTSLAGLSDTSAAGASATPWMTGNTNQGSYSMKNPLDRAAELYSGAANTSAAGLRPMGSTSDGYNYGGNAQARDVAGLSMLAFM